MKNSVLIEKVLAVFDFLRQFDLSIALFEELYADEVGAEHNTFAFAKVLTLSKKAAGRRLFEVQGIVSPSADGDLRNFFEKKFQPACRQWIIQKTFLLLFN